MDWLEWQVRSSEKCEYCSTEFTSSNTKTIDHIIPKTRGGSYRNETWNLTAACVRCNRRKSDYISNSIPWVRKNRDLLVEDIIINKLKIR